MKYQKLDRLSVRNLHDLLLRGPQGSDRLLSGSVDDNEFGVDRKEYVRRRDALSMGAGIARWFDTQSLNSLCILPLREVLDPARRKNRDRYFADLSDPATWEIAARAFLRAATTRDLNSESVVTCALDQPNDGWGFRIDGVEEIVFPIPGRGCPAFVEDAETVLVRSVVNFLCPEVQSDEGKNRDYEIVR